MTTGLIVTAPTISGAAPTSPAAGVHAADWPHLVSSAAPNPTGAGYWDVYEDGTVSTAGGAGFYGDRAGQALNAPVVDIAPTSDGKGYWLLGADGGIFTYGDAKFHGSMGGVPLNQPVVGMASTADNRGYWEVAGDGGIFTFGDARFLGSTGNLHLNSPIVGMAVTPDGAGYWLVAADGGIFTFGDAGFYGSTGSLHLNAPVVGMARTPDGKGYWLVASDGGIFTFGDARFYGSDPARGITTPASGIVPSTNGGYTVILDNGQIETYSPPAPPAPETAWLSDSPPVDYDTQDFDGTWTEGGATADGVYYAHAIGTTAACQNFDGGDTWYEWNLGRQWSTLTGTVAIDDNSPTGSKMTWIISLDGRQAATGTLGLGQSAPINLDVTGVYRIRLEMIDLNYATCNGNNPNYYLIWGNLELTQ